jgi:hypothetical protein
MEMLVDACPSFKGKWDAYVNGPDYDEDLLYISLGEFTHHIVELMRHRETKEFLEIFKVVEKLLIDGDSYVKEATTIGLLEGIQNTSSDHFDPELFVAYLLPETKKWWQKLNDFWNGKGHLKDDINEKGS